MPATAGTVRDVLDPASDEVIAQVADAGPADVDAAVAQARAVFDDGAWARLPGGQRARILWRIADLIEEHADELARLESSEHLDKVDRLVKTGVEIVTEVVTGGARPTDPCRPATSTGRPCSAASPTT